MSIKPSHILGMNGRQRYTKMNPSSAKKYGFSKIRAKELLIEHNIPTAQIYHTFENLDDMEAVSWETIQTPFVIKPASGSAGKGIKLIKSKVKNQLIWIDHEGQEVTVEELTYHVNNILDGEYSTWGRHHRAIVEEMITSHPSLAKFSHKGTPDIRVVVFNNVPVMAMARIPTKESQGKANLDQGALGLGIDLATGITIHGISGKSGNVSHFPDSKKKVNGIKIPYWNKILETAVKAADAAGFVFMGADIFIDQDKGPLVVELNGYPGLSIQMANQAGLKRRLDRVEGLEVRNPEHGVKIAQALFAESFADQIKIEKGLQVISSMPNMNVYDDNGVAHNLKARVNTGRYRSAISEKLAESLGLLDIDDLLWRQQEGLEGRLPVVEVKFRIKGRSANTGMVVTKRLDKTGYKVDLGRRDIGGFLIGEIEE
jgi:alpha-L-glutamate ligase-like protein